METVTLILPLEAKTLNNPRDNSEVTAGAISGAIAGAIAGATAGVKAAVLID